MSAVGGVNFASIVFERVMQMIIETFDQRFKRLTSDMLMLDICRTLGIEIRELMKIRSGIRVELSMDRVRRLCQEQGLDFASFVRDYAAPWTAELKPTTPTVTVETAAPARRQPVEAAKNSDERRNGGGGYLLDAPEPIVVGRGSQMATVTSNESTPSVPHSVVGRIKAAVASAAALLTPELPETVDEPVGHETTSYAESYAYTEPKKTSFQGMSKDDQAAIQTILAEVTFLRRDVSTLTARIDELIGR